MKVKWKIIISLVVLVVLGIGLYASTVYSKQGVVTVQTGQVVRQDLTSLVTASGEIKPKNYINIGANARAISRKFSSKRATMSARASCWPRSKTCSPPPTWSRRKPL